ncbi:MAG TPA: CBS domain-containing protein [Methanoregulaceae archaeon]|nr:CBS domain-containing protein [Methanoregulaceae archaeon]
MIASDIMTSPVYVVSLSETVAHARNLMIRHKISRLPVIDGTLMVGIVTKKDIGYRLRQTEPLWRRRPVDLVPVSILMTPGPCYAETDTPVRTLAGLMVEHSISGIPILEDGTLAGIVTKSDLLKSSLAGNLKEEVRDLMEDVVQINRYHSLDHVIDTMCERNDKLVVVNNDGSLAGIISESNLAFFRYPEGRSNGVPEKEIMMLRKEESAGRKHYRDIISLSAIAEDVMSGPVLTITPDAPVREAVETMRKEHVSTLVVVDGNEIKGILKRDDIIKDVAK